MELTDNSTQSQADEKTVGHVDNSHDKQGYSHQEDVGSGDYADESGEQVSEPPVSSIIMSL